MQFYALVALLSVAVANPVRRQDVVDGTQPAASSSCTRSSAPRTCVLGGDRVATCTQGLCEAGWAIPFNATDLAANQASCEGKASGDACDAVWTCCPASA